jgi:hypothetical protein
MMSSSVSMASNWGLFLHVFFIVECFYGETFLFYGVTISTGGSFSGVDLPPPCSSAPPCPYSSSPPPPSETDTFYSETLSSSLVSISWTSSCFFVFIIPLDCPTCSTQVNKGLPMVSMLESYASMTGARTSSGHSLVMFSCIHLLNYSMIVTVPCSHICMK